MTAATTTLPLFWHLSSANKVERIDASTKLVSALEQFQEKHLLGAKHKDVPNEGEDDDEEHPSGEDNENAELKVHSASLDSDNAADVAYAIRRLVRGLASPRESSRLGFAVALTELLSRMDTISCEQILVLLKNASQTTGSMSGQEERDMLFARLFGLKAIVQSGVLLSQKPLRSSSTSSSSLKGFEVFLLELITLGDKKSWLRESCWWTLLSAVKALSTSEVPWKATAYDMLLDRVYVGDKSWSPEKIALTLILQKALPKVDWQIHCASYFKGSDVLSNPNMPSLARLLKESLTEESSQEGTSKQTAGPWKPQLHFVWDVILDTLLSPEKSSTSNGSFQDFYRIVVDESLFAASSSPQRKYWGFLVFQKALHRLPPTSFSMLFTQNFMRTWINQLSKNDRYLNKIAAQVASDVQQVVEKDPKSGLSLVLQLTGTNGSFHFDRITKTKTVENLITSMDSAGVAEYISYLLIQVNEGEQGDSFASVDARRAWIIEQLAALLRKASIPKTDDSIQLILTWLTTHAFFKVVKKSSKSSNTALHYVPEPAFSDELRSTCKTKLLSCLGDLTNAVNLPGTEEGRKAAKTSGVASDGEFWIAKVLKTILELEKDMKHAEPLHELGEDELKIRKQALSAIETLKTTAKDQEPARGAELLLNALVLKCMCDDEHEADWDGVQECATVATELFATATKPDKKKKKKEAKLDENEEPERPPIDLIVDFIIGLLEQSTNFSRVVANQSFSMLTPMVVDSTVDLILAQLERRNPNEEVIDEEMDVDDEAEDSEQEDSEESGDGESDEDSDSGASEEEEEESGNDEDTEALRKALQVAMSGHDADGDSSSDEASMDDEQMMAIDEKLAAVFRTRAEERKKGKDVGAQREATYFKNRVLDLVETYMKRQLTNPLIFRFILPLVELVATSSSDEKQLSDKAKGILRSRLSKPKDTIAIKGVHKAVELLESLHSRARRAHSQDTVSTISTCSLFVAKSLAQVDERAVLRIYKESISDFITRKASSLNPAFIIDFIRRHPLMAWSMRSHIIDIIGSAVNGYRQAQSFVFVQTILTSLPQPESQKEELKPFFSAVSTTLLETLNKACVAEKPLLNSGHAKEALDIAMQLCRFSKRFITDPEDLKQAWKPAKWEKLASTFSSSEHYKASTSLMKLCQQISKRSQPDGPKGSTKEQDGSVRKRKQGTESGAADQEDGSPKKRKRKKMRKASKEHDE
ncbi:uncharacterized protein FOMMEDRAFT_104342 [Fomitiporia mediterranea MF3/22]|uniref:uncharacterized protein n=1 Tax=Fomitiporia mediterranea (strain MF3/22) TaxID=694068 RepID=UPI00044087A7|nr:uncharacterized protein FOMMEDRAFT_104342 [Fomitiporia mediterranea MF3/22]EJD05959.1 hypothetical protein FOMMEDRAFT_104342 [Fomitiporia mediterranea MF3/22]